MTRWTAGPPALVALLALAAAVPRPLSGQLGCPETGFEASVAPAWLDDTRGDRGFGVALGLAACRPDYDTRPRFPRARYLGVRGDGTLPASRMDVPQNLEASVWYGLSVSLSERAPDDPDAPLDEAPDAYAFHYGFLAVGVRGQYEASGDFDERALAAGAELRWVDPRRPLLPSVVVALDLVKPTASEARDTLGLERDVHGRLGVRGYWLVPLGGRLGAEVHGAWFSSFGLDEVLAERGWDQGPYVAAELELAVDRPLGPLDLDAVFVGWAWGQRPTAGDEARAWTLGAELGLR